MLNSKCKICRRLGVKLFLKGERCLSPKCPMVKRAYPPGQKRKRRAKGTSEYGQELREKQKLKNWYNLSERQFKNYVKKILEKRQRKEDASLLLIRELETRLDNVVFRLGLASSRQKARQLVSHGHFSVNDKKINIPSYHVKNGDVIKVLPKSIKRIYFQNLSVFLKKYQPASWLEINAKNLSGKVKELPQLDQVLPPAEISKIFEYYSR